MTALTPPATFCITGADRSFKMRKVLYIICDGLGDLPTKGKTPLSSAQKPNIDSLAKQGQCGLLHTIGRGIVPGSDTAHLALFGYNPYKYYPGRGTFEALGARMKLKAGDVAFRCNFATVDSERKVLDRRAGRLKNAKPLESAINAIKLKGCTLKFASTVEHRGVLVLHGEGLSKEVSDTDPHEIGRRIMRCKPLDKSAEAQRTASLVNEFTRHAVSVLRRHKFNANRSKPANALLLRGAGCYSKVDGIEKRYGIKATCIAGGALYKGVARFVGMHVPYVRGATGRADTDLEAKARAALSALKEREVVVIHIKATDSFSHDGDFEGKQGMIERIDKMIGLLKQEAKDAYFILTGDHSTPVALKAHSHEPVPVLISGPQMRSDSVKTFDEFSCASGSLGHLTGLELFRTMVGLTRKAEKFGS